METVDMSNIGVYFVPDYLDNNIKINGNSLEDMLLATTSVVSSIKFKDVGVTVSEYEAIRAIADIFKEHIATDDLKNLVVANKIGSAYIYGGLPWCYHTGNGYSVIKSIIDDTLVSVDSYNDFVDSYIDTKLDIKSIILNGNNEMVDKLFTIKIVDSNVFVITHVGFTNAVESGDLTEFGVILAERILRLLITRLDKELVYTSKLFKQFTLLKIKQHKGSQHG